MHSKYAKDGLVAISVNLDDPGKKEDREKAEKFLRAKKATLTNVMLDEKPEDWAKEPLKIEGLPTVFVFNPEGKIEVRFPNPDKEAFDYTDVEKVVKDLLKK
jgi:hypothetical protein